MQRRLKSNGVNEPAVICYNIETSGGASGVGPSGSGAGASGSGSGIGAMATATSSGVAAAVSQLPTVIPPPPASLPPLTLPLEVPPAPAPPSVRWSNDIRQRHVALSDDMLPPPPPPPQGVERFGPAYKTAFAPDPPDLVV